MLSVGKVVVYRHHTCSVVGICENYYNGKDYIELVGYFDDRVKYYIPLEDAVEPNVRPVMTKQAAIDLIDSFGCIEPLNFKKACEGVTTQSVLDRRVKEFYNEQLKAEEIVPLVSVVKTTYGRMQERALKGKHVAGVDKDYFKLTEAMLNDELAVALNIPRDEIEGYIEKRLSE